MSFVNVLRRLTVFAGLVGILGASLSGCGSGGSSSSNNGGGGGGGGGRGVCQPNTHAGGRARWTVLVYMNASNNLQPFSLLNIAQMASVGSDGANVNIVVQWKQSNAPDSGSPTFVGTRRYYIHPHSAAQVGQICSNLQDETSCTGNGEGNTSVLDSDRLADPGTNNGNTHQSDMGDYRTLADFVQWGAKSYPADNLALVIWDHGSGWQPAYRSARKNRMAPVFRAVSQDNETQNEIETWEIPLALANPPQTLDMLIIDCSLEQMLEVAYEVRNSARVMVGSEESPPGAGYPYDKWLGDLKVGGANACDVGSSIVKDFVAAYPNDSDITQSVLDLSKMQTVANAQEGLAVMLLKHVQDQASVYANARNNAQSYIYPDNKDLYNYADLIRTKTTASDLQQAAASLQSALTGSNGAILAAGHGPSQANSNGLAIYVPLPTNYLASYANLALSKTGAAPDWARFLQSQVQ